MRTAAGCWRRWDRRGEVRRYRPARSGYALANSCSAASSMATPGSSTRPAGRVRMRSGWRQTPSLAGRGGRRPPRPSRPWSPPARDPGRRSPRPGTGPVAEALRGDVDQAGVGQHVVVAGARVPPKMLLPITAR
jgi:hypothetical protein